MHPMIAEILAPYTPPTDAQIERDMLEQERDVLKKEIEYLQAQIDLIRAVLRVGHT